MQTNHFASQFQDHNSKDVDWSSLGDQFTQLASQCYELNASATTNIPIPQLSTFEKLLSTIDNETNQGHAQTRTDVELKSNSNYDFGFNFDIKSLQQY